MTVSELIDALKKMPQDAKVLIVNTREGKWDCEVRDVIYNERQEYFKQLSHTVELDNWPPLP